MKQIFSEKAPDAIGPYSHAVVFQNIVFCSGQIGLVPETMSFAGEDIEDQTAQAIENLETVLLKAGSELSKILKTTVFLSSMEDFKRMNNVYEKCFKGHKPARSAYEVSRLPKDAKVEIECIAAVE